jgi:hypothetical protein
LLRNADQELLETPVGEACRPSIEMGEGERFVVSCHPQISDKFDINGLLTMAPYFFGARSNG